MTTAEDDVLTVTVPRAVVEFLEGSDSPDVAEILSNGRKGHGGGWRVTAKRSDLLYLLDRCWVLAGGEGVDSDPRERAAYRRFERAIESGAPEDAAVKR